jgi:Tripartite tricarboxylate transporter TctB family
MVDTMGRSPDSTALPIRNSSAAIAVLVLAFAPQLFDLIWSIGGWMGSLAGLVKPPGRNPAQVLAGQGAALLFALPSLAVGSFGATAKAALSSGTLLALIYTYPLLAVAAFTLFVTPRAPQDYFGGIVLIAITLFALWASSDLDGMRGFSFGAGTATRMFGVLLLALGAGVAVVGLMTDGPKLAAYAWRGPLFVSLAILSFALTIRPLGLVFSAFASFMISAMGTPETRWTETVIVGICLTIGCSLLFPYALGLPLQLFPRFLLQ